MSDWQSLGGYLASGPAAASWGGQEVQVFCLQEDGAVWNRYWDGDSWHDWESLGGSFTGQPAASARDADRIDVMAIGADGLVQRRFWDGREWTPWTVIEGAPEGAKAVECSWTGSRLDIFVWGPTGHLWHGSL